MPTTKDQREILAETTETGAAVSNISVSFSAEFNNEFGGTILFQDTAPTDHTCDKTKRQISLLTAAGTTVAELTAKLVTKVVNLGTFAGTTNVSSAREVTDPAYTEGRVKLNGSGTGSWYRIWKQKIKDSSGTSVVRHVVKLDVDLEALDPSYAVSYTVKTQDDHTLTLNYSIVQGRTTYADGVVTMTVTATAAAGYTEESIVLSDDNS